MLFLMTDPQGPFTSSNSKVSFGKPSIREFDGKDPPSSVGHVPPNLIHPNSMSLLRKFKDGPKKPRKRKPDPNPSGDIPNKCLPPEPKRARGRGRKKQLATMTPEQIAAEQEYFLEKNRKAAAECRKRKKAEREQLEADVAAAVVRDAKQRKTIKELHSTIGRLQAKLGIHPKAGSGLPQKEKRDLGIALRAKIEDGSADFQGAFCGADSTGASGYSRIAFQEKAKVPVVKGELPELGDLSATLPHADKPVKGPEVDPILALVSLTLRQVNGELAKMGFNTETVPRGYDPNFVQTVVQKVRRDPVLAHPPWPWWHGKRNGSTITRERPSHVDPTVVLPEGTKY